MVLYSFLMFTAIIIYLFKFYSFSCKFFILFYFLFLFFVFVSVPSFQGSCVMWLDLKILQNMYILIRSMSQCRLLSKYSLGGVFYVVVLFFSFSNWFEFYVQFIKPSKAKDSKNLAFLKNFKPMEHLNHSIKIKN